MKATRWADGLFVSIALAISGWSLYTTVTLTNEVTKLSMGKADKSTVYALKETQAVLAETLKGQTLILKDIERALRND